MAPRSGLVIIPAAKDGKSRTIVALRKPVLPDDNEVSAMHCDGILARELIRQSMLIAARDELGLTTRDELLGDLVPAHGNFPRVELASLTSDSQGVPDHLFVDQGDGPGAKRLLDIDLPHPNLLLGGFSQLVETAEGLSRREFPALLRKLGADGKPGTVRPEGKLPPGVEDQLAQIGLTGPIAAVRAVHEAIWTSGESAERVGALARGYALLGVLSEQHWHPAHKAFKARSLLYAQRLAARDPRSTWALWNRAYVRALVGLHRDAAADLATAAGLPSATGGPARPDWVALVDALAHDDGHRLSEVQGPQARLAALFRLLIVEFPPGSRLALDAARQVVELEPECFRAIDAMCRFPGVSNGQTATSIGPEVFAQKLPAALKKMNGFPVEPLKHLDHPVGGNAALFTKLEQAGAAGTDQGELSWSVLGHLLRETRFIQVFRRLYFMRYAWSVPVDEYWNESHLDVAEHRFYPFLEMLAVPSADPVQTHRAFFDRLLTLDLEPREDPMFRILRQSKNRNAVRTWSTSMFHSDQTPGDLSEIILNSDPEEKVKFARVLLEVCPDSPYAVASLIEHDRNTSKEELAQWEKQAEHSPALLGAFGRRYTEEKNPEKAERYLARYVDRAPDCWATIMLADNYKARGDMKRWQETLERVLKGEDTGLDHAQAGVQLANSFMDQGQWAKAKPYAEAAAESWANWAMACAQRNAEGMKEWDRAVLCAQRRTERYPEQSLFTWYLLCVRTGRGDVKAARQFTDEYLQEHGGLAPVAADLRGSYQWLRGDLKGALGSFRKAYEEAPSAMICFTILELADLLGDKATVDEFRRELPKYAKEAPKMVQVFELLPEAVKGGKTRPPDMKAIEAVLQTMPAERRPNLGLEIGLYLKAHGPAAAARPYLEACVASRVPTEWNRALAAQALRSAR
jgi:tetratricopeptide (TPR) repeat protein